MVISVIIGKGFFLLYKSLANLKERLSIIGYDVDYPELDFDLPKDDDVLHKRQMFMFISKGCKNLLKLIESDGPFIIKVLKKNNI